MLERIDYSALNARQKENFNFQKIAGQLADYGFNCLRLTDDWNGADFLAIHIDGQTFLKVQVKARFSVDAKYCGKEIYIAFMLGDRCFLYPHDEALEQAKVISNIGETKSWIERGIYNWPTMPAWAQDLLKQYEI